MASGAVMPLSGPIPPATSAADLSSFDGGSTPAEQIPVWLFDASGAEYLDFRGRLENYGGGGLTLRIPWSADATGSVTVQWEAAFRRVADDAEDLDASHTYDFNVSSVTVATVAGEVDYATVTFSDGTDMDSLADGEVFILRVRRNPAGTDTMSGDAELHADWVTLIET